MEIITAGAAVVLLLLVLWGVSCRRRLAVLAEDTNNAMTRIGVQISSRFDALIALLDLIKRYDVREAQMLLETIQSRRGVITAASTPDDVLKQEDVIDEVLGRIFIVAGQYPNLKADENYAKCMNAVDTYEKMVCTSRLLYNDSVTKLNRELRMFPASLIARGFGFRQRDYLEAAEDKAA